MAKPCPFCGDHHKVVMVGRIIGWTDPDHDGVQHPINGDYKPFVVLECADTKVEIFIPLYVWELRHEEDGVYG